MGGNHLNNLLSTSERFKTRMSGDFYNNITINAHPVNEVCKKIQVNDISNVACCHLTEYLWQSSALDLVDKKLIAVEFPRSSRNDLFFKRITDLYPYYSNRFLLEELATIYSVDTIKNITKLNDITPLSVDKIFNEDSQELVDYLNENFDLKLNYQIIQPLHTKWIQMISG